MTVEWSLSGFLQEIRHSGSQVHAYVSCKTTLCCKLTHLKMSRAKSVDPYAVLRCWNESYTLQPLQIMLPEDMDSWQNSGWRFIHFKQAKPMKNKLERLCLHVVSNLQVFHFSLIYNFLVIIPAWASICLVLPLASLKKVCCTFSFYCNSIPNASPNDWHVCLPL